MDGVSRLAPTTAHGDSTKQAANIAKLTGLLGGRRLGLKNPHGHKAPEHFRAVEY